MGGLLLRVVKGVRPSRMNPRFCNDCERFADDHRGGAEVDLAVVFVDVRGSTSIAERLTPREFTVLVDRFHRIASTILIRSDAMVEKLVGDQLTGLYVPGYAGEHYARKALEAAIALQKRARRDVGEGEGLPVGVGVHTGRAYIGTVGSSEGIVEITALGDDMNTGARLCQAAGPGELIVSERCFRAAAVEVESSEPRELRLKGRENVVLVRTIGAE
jgi:adenylate cyclase